jgi:hypothetical protein
MDLPPKEGKINKIGQEVRKESRFCKEPCNVLVIAKDPLSKNDLSFFKM